MKIQPSSGSTNSTPVDTSLALSRPALSRRGFIRSVILAIVAMGLVACASGSKVTANYDRSADFSAYRTFGFFETLGTDAAAVAEIFAVPIPRRPVIGS